MSTRDHIAPGDETPVELSQSMDRHPTALGRHLDDYLAAVAQELQVHGIVTGALRRGDPAHRMICSIVLDCTAFRVPASTTPASTAPASTTPEGRIVDVPAPGGAPDPGHPAPVVVTWGENTGWCVGLHHDPTHSSRRYLHPDLFPTPGAVADFVLGLAMGQPLGATHPIRTATPGGLRLRLVP